MLPRSGPNDIFISFFSKYSFIRNAKTFYYKGFLYLYPSAFKRTTIGVYNRHL